MFVPEVFATDAPSNAASVGASLVSFIPLILIVIVFYFFIIRPNQKRLKERRKMLDKIKRGDTVITSGGMIGEVIKIDELNVQFVLEIAPKVEVKVLKSAISEVLNKEVQKTLAKPAEKSKVEKENKKNKNQPVRSKKGQGDGDKNAL